MPRPRSVPRSAALVGVTVVGLLTAATVPAVAAGGVASAPSVAPSAAPGPGPDLSEWGVGQDRPTPGGERDTGADEAARTADAASSSASAAAPSSWVVRGAGWGHSLGMSQYGAMEMAKDGRTAKQILAHYYTGTTYDAVPDSVWVNVNLLQGTTSTTVTSAAHPAGATGGGRFTVTVGGAAMQAGGPASVTFSMAGGQVRATCASCTPTTTLDGASAVVEWDDRSPSATGPTLLTVGGKKYRDGVLVVTPRSTTSLNVVNQVRVHDEYLDYLAESPWSWPVEALKAQAAAARGYVLVKQAAGLRSSCNCHVLNTSADQVFGGYSTVLSNGNEPYWPSWRSAVRATGSATTGYVARSGGAIISAYYSSSHGGRSENNEDVWGGTPLSYIRGVDDPWSLRPSNPNRSWRSTPSQASLASAFGLADVVRLDLRDRTVNGGVHTATATSSSGATATITGEQLRTRLGIKSIAVRHLTGRLSGSDRYATGAAVAQRVAPSATSVVLAAGDSSLVDAAVSGPLAGTLVAPLLLTARTYLPAATVAELNRRGSTVRTAYVVGGPGVVSEAVVSALKGRGLTVVRVAGSDRYGTSEAVAAQIASRRTVSGIVVVGGDGLADALGASGAANATKEPILLTPAAGLAEATRRALTTTKATHARVVGGESVVGPAVVSELTSRGLQVVRLAGDDRYGSSAAVAEFYRTRVPSTAEVVLTAGADEALVDSLVAGSLGKLLVLTSRGSLPEATARTLQRTADLDLVTAVGGTSAVPAGLLTAAARS
ncbi:SpoIID/LytB domain-containing protein [Oryzobacter sp. R7]|uniref:SpoIID/LytB domain-containing protein n=1 Tax=Oryzobacter faecalis TaxID=3388656 RepID=UPI00398D212C